MLSLRSLAFILASAIRRERALSCAALHRSPERISGRKMATNMATNMAINMAINRAASMSVSYESLHLSLGSDATSRRCRVQKYNQRRVRTLPAYAPLRLFTTARKAITARPDYAVLIFFGRYPWQ
jgi:hypothetical protein